MKSKNICHSEFSNSVFPVRKCCSLKQRHWQFQTQAARECLPKCCHSGLPKWKKNRHTSLLTKEVHPA